MEIESIKNIKPLQIKNFPLHLHNALKTTCSRKNINVSRYVTALIQADINSETMPDNMKPLNAERVKSDVIKALDAFYVTGAQ